MADAALAYLLRHGRAAAGFSEDTDPALDATGFDQAQDAARVMAQLGPMPIMVSPLRRTRETAAPFEEQWKQEAVVTPEVSEIPSPTDDLEARGQWLRGFMVGTWTEQPGGLLTWKAELIDTVKGIETDTLIVSHFVAINALVSEATGEDRVTSFRPDHCSVTVFRVEDGKIHLHELGREQDTEVR